MARAVLLGIFLISKPFLHFSQTLHTYKQAKNLSNSLRKQYIHTMVLAVVDKVLLVSPDEG